MLSEGDHQFMDIRKLRIEALKRLIGTLKIKEFADQHDLDASYISQMLNGHRGMGDVAARNLEKKIGLPDGYLVMPKAAPEQADQDILEPGPPITSPWRQIKIVGTAQMGTQGYWYAIENGDGYVEFPSRDPGAYALRLKGNSMAPAIKNGWVAVVEPNGQLIPGEYVMVRLHDGESMVKELLYANDVEVSLASVNDAYDRRTIPVEQIQHIHYVGAVCPPSKVKM